MNIEKQFYFGNEDITQSFPLKSKTHSPTKKFLEDKTIYESVAFENEDELSQKIEDYKDLGREYFDFLHNEYKKRNMVKCYDPVTLFEFWKSLRNQHKKKEEQKKIEKFNSTLKAMKENKTISLETQKRLLKGEGTFKKPEAKDDPSQLKLISIVTSKPGDVSYTLKLHSKDAENELKISNFMEDRKFALKKEELASKKKNKQLSQKCQERLYPASSSKIQTASLFDRLAPLFIKDNPSQDIEINDVTLFNYWREMPPHVKEKQKLNNSNPLEVKILLEQSYSEKSTEFCEQLEKLYKIENPSHKDYKRANIMIEFWKNYNGEELSNHNNIFKEIREVIRVVEKFYNDKIKVLCSLFSDRYGFEVDDCKDAEGKVKMTKQMRLFKFWKEELGSNSNESKNEKSFHKSFNQSEYQQSFISNMSKKSSNTKKLKKLDFECDENVIFLIEEYFKDVEYRNNLMNQQREHEEKRREQAKKEEERKKSKTNEEKEKFYEELAQPKDRLKLGKALLHLRKMFPKDKILLKMILHEFKENKVSKYPLEYDHYDSEEEELIKGYDQDEKEKALYIRDKERENEIIEHFINDIEKYYNEKTASLLKTKQKYNNEKQEEIKIKRYMENIAKTFINLRKRRFEEKIPTLNEYLSEKYKEIKFLHKATVKRMFPHMTYGESKRLKKKSYPVTFKRYFFQTVRSFAKKKNEFEKPNKKKLPFWAPPSNNSRCRLHNDIDCPIDCKFQTLNRIVMDLSKTTKESLVLQNSKGKCKVWEIPTYFQDRLSVMTTFSDAKNCTFTPAILSRMPDKHRAFMESIPSYQSWVQDKLVKPRTFEAWVAAMGDNFSRRFPNLYKYGVFKRCVNWWRRGENVKAYKKLAEVFDIEKIKAFFNPNYQGLPKESMFTYENLCIEKEKLNLYEDFDKKKNINFLYDVYKLVTYLEEYETEILKMKREIQMRLLSEKNQNNMLINEKSSFFETKEQSKFDKNFSYASRRAQIKSHMCPLGENCPDDIRPRWPHNNNKTILPFGAQCPFAHHAFELKFKNELKTRRKMLENNLKMLDKHLSSMDVAQVVWVPGGRTIVDCIGCGEQLGSKGQKGGYVKKGLCAMCEIRKAITKKLEGYLTKANLKRKEIVKQKSFRDKNKIKKMNEENLNKKLGFLQRANLLYSKERYAEAFAIIVKAVEIVKREIENDEAKQKNLEDEWKAKLELNYEGNPTAEEVFKEQYMSKTKEFNDDKNDPDLENEKNYTQKLTLYANKTGLLGEKHLNVNEFINHQIELMYLKIEKKFLDKQKDITIMKKTIDKLEGGETNYIEEKQEENQENNVSIYRKRMKVKKTIMCENIKLFGKCDKLKDPVEPCLYAHNATELDLIDDEIKINNLQKTIKFCNLKMVDTQTPLAWKPTSKKDAIKNIKEFDEGTEIKLKVKKEMKKNSSTTTNESLKDKPSMMKSIYEKDIDDLARFPYEKKKQGIGFS